MKYLLILLAIASLSCNKTPNNLYEGDIYVKLIDVNNILYGLPDNKIEEFKKSISNIEQNNYSESEKKYSITIKY